MEKKNLKKLLAGLGIVSLIGAGSMTISGCATSGSGWSADKQGAGSVEKKAGDSAGSADEKKAGDSGWSGSK